MVCVRGTGFTPAGQGEASGHDASSPVEVQPVSTSAKTSRGLNISEKRRSETLTGSSVHPWTHGPCALRTNQGLRSAWRHHRKQSHADVALGSVFSWSSVAVTDDQRDAFSPACDVWAHSEGRSHTPVWGLWLHDPPEKATPCPTPRHRGDISLPVRDPETKG